MKYRSVGVSPVLPRRTLDYLQHGASQGTRNAELFDAACQFRDATVDVGEAEARLMSRALADGLSEAEARTAIRSAYAHAAREPVTPGESPRSLPSAPTRLIPLRDAKPQPVSLPEPLEGGFQRFIEVCFQPGEYVSIAPAGENESGEVVPKRGVTLPVEDWLARVEKKGGIERCFSTTLGLFVRVNPMKKDGAKNEDVTSFRHVLVEFDRNQTGEVIPKEAQYGAIVASGLPVSAVIDSGNKSLHAWVRVEAPNPQEYSRRVGLIWQWFEGLSLDKQNKNASRLSRCPDGRRTVDGEIRHQRLLGVHLGKASWSEWEISMAAHGAGELLRISELAAYDTSHDPNNVLGQRWLCRGSSLVIVGQSGIGKSSFCMQLMILWALGLAALGIKPVRPLRSLLIQAENDPGDLAEMYQGVRQGMSITSDHQTILEERVFIYRDTTHTGSDFVTLASALIERHQPDLVWCDPLLNYIGDEISEQKVISDFCCRQLNAVSQRTGVIWCLLHHTGKPSRDPKAASHWTASDLAYSGLGSSALVNWSRETAVLARVKTPDGMVPTFQLSMTKRRKRAGLKTVGGEPTDTIFLCHSDKGGICWQQCDAPPTTKSTSRYQCVGRPSAYDDSAFRAAIADVGGSLTRENVASVAAKMIVGERTIWRWWKKLNPNNV